MKQVTLTSMSLNPSCKRGVRSKVRKECVPVSARTQIRTTTHTATPTLTLMLLRGLTHCLPINQRIRWARGAGRAHGNTRA